MPLLFLARDLGSSGLLFLLLVIFWLPWLVPTLRRYSVTVFDAVGTVGVVDDVEAVEAVNAFDAVDVIDAEDAVDAVDAVEAVDDVDVVDAGSSDATTVFSSANAALIQFRLRKMKLY